MVFVLSKSGKPLMPTERYRHVRILLKTKKAVPVSNEPFTIRLKYDTPEIVQPLYMGVDPGRENIGIGVSKEDGTCVFLAELETNNRSIKKSMDERRSQRRQRRHNRRLRKQRKAMRDGVQMERNTKEDTLRHSKPCRSREYVHPGFEAPAVHKAVKGKEPRFQNRRRPEGWLTPSGRQLLEMHMGLLKLVTGFLPISHVILERNVFDFQKMENQDIKSWEYSKGPLYGWASYKDYISALQGGVCLLCGERPIEQYHHIRPRSRGGSDTTSNIAGLCGPCHNGPCSVHKSEEAAQELKKKKEGLGQKYKVGLLNTAMPFLIEEMEALCEEKDIKFSLTDGYETFKRRKELGIGKKHCFDGHVISLAGRMTERKAFPEFCYRFRRFKKKGASNIWKLGKREYYERTDEGLKLVAVNRHKAEGQTADSLAEYKARYLEDYDERALENRLKELIVKPARRVYTAHKYGLSSDVHTGDIVKYEKKNKVKGNTKTMMFVADSVSPLTGEVRHGTKAKNLCYCRSIKRGAIACIRKDELLN